MKKDWSHFNNSKPFTLGVELEVQIVDNRNFKLVSKAEEIFKNISEKNKKFIHPELLKSMVEIVTPVCNSSEEVIHYIKQVVKEIREIGKKHSFEIVALGTHVTARRDDVEITYDKRYLKFLEEFQIVLRNFLIYGLHIHVGFPYAESAVRAFNFLREYLPVFLSMSTSSPFFEGEFTGLHSYRTKIFEQLPRAGIPDYFNNYNHFQELMNQLFESGTINSIKDVWWDLRIHPNFGTIELRICDAINDIERIELLVVLFQAICMYALDNKAENTFFQIVKQNKWNAARHSLNGKFISKDKTSTFKQTAFELVEKMRKKGIFQELKTEDKIQDLMKILDKKPISQNLIEIFNQTQNFAEVEKIGILK